jgi:hypothetical protein
MRAPPSLPLIKQWRQHGIAAFSRAR